MDAYDITKARTLYENTCKKFEDVVAKVNSEIGSASGHGYNSAIISAEIIIDYEKDFKTFYKKAGYKIKTNSDGYIIISW